MTPYPPIRFIVVEGPNTSTRTLLADALASALGAWRTEEPGEIVRDPQSRVACRDSVRRAASLRAARSREIAERLARGEMVVCDRWVLGQIDTVMRLDAPRDGLVPSVFGGLHIQAIADLGLCEAPAAVPDVIFEADVDGSNHTAPQRIVAAVRANAGVGLLRRARRAAICARTAVGRVRQHAASEAPPLPDHRRGHAGGAGSDPRTARRAPAAADRPGVTHAHLATIL